MDRPSCGDATVSQIAAHLNDDGISPRPCMRDIGPSSYSALLRAEFLHRGAVAILQRSTLRVHPTTGDDGGGSARLRLPRHRTTD
jgi:hypothetical protein